MRKKKLPAKPPSIWGIAAPSIRIFPSRKADADLFPEARLARRAGKLVSENFYWLSTKADELDWAKRADTVYTPQKEFGDLTGLNSLPKVKVRSPRQCRGAENNSSVTVVAENKSDSVAFMIHRGSPAPRRDDVTPIFWSDNYFSLLQGEKTVTARFDSAALMA